MSQVSQSSTLDPALRKRERLLNAIGLLEVESTLNAASRVAIAEAEFRLAILPGTDSREAIAYIQKAIALDPFHPKYFFHLGRLFYRNGDYRNALHEFRRALKLAPASHRAYVHLALTLIELEETEKNLGRNLLDALARGAEHELGQHLVDLDALLETKLTDGKKAQPAGKQKAKESKEDTNQQPTVPCRWNGVWRLALVEQLTRPKPLPKQIKANLERGEKSLDGEASVAEYAMACLFLLLGGDPPKAVGAMLRSPKLQPHADHPAVQLVGAAVVLAESETADQFVERAADILHADFLPLEIVCCLHYLKHGPDSSLSASEALNLLNAYPQPIQENGCFRELRLAVLDGYARRAWAEERFNHARLLWRETIALDSHRIAIFHNLALLATRTKSRSDYASMWTRAAELRYLHAAAVGDVQVMLDDRRTMHLSFAQQSRQRYCKPGRSPEQPPQQEELEGWLNDNDALEVWLREWDLYYLNSRLLFNSPVHLLGIARDASAEVASSARDALLRQIETSLRVQPWAGIKTFCTLAKQRVSKAFESFSDLVARTRDPHYEQEKSDADKLSTEAIDRGFLLHRMMTLLADKPSKRNIAIGCALARHLFALPWKILQPICVNQGKIERDLDLVKVFESYFLAVVAGQSEPKNDEEVSERLSVLGECLAILPHKLELRILRCQALLSAKKNAEAYSSALEAYVLAEKIENKEEALKLKQNCVNLVDSAAFAELPEQLRRPQNLQQAEETLKQGQRVLEKFPKAGALRAFLADLMIQLGTENHTKEAALLLEDGLKEALNDEQLEQFQSLQQKAGVQSRVAGVRDKIRKLLEGASQRVKKAIDEIQSNPSVESIQKGRKILVAAIRDAERAKEQAIKAGLKDEETQAEALIQQIKDIQKKLQDH